MGDKATLAKAKMELEELYLGVPDESVNLTFQDFAQVRQQNAEKNKFSPSPTFETISEKPEKSAPLTKLPSLDFSKALEAASLQNTHKHGHHNLHHHRADVGLGGHRTYGHDHPGFHYFGHHRAEEGRGGHHGYGHNHDHRHHLQGAGDQRSMVYADMSHVSGMSVAYGGGRRRPGIPHSNICTVCSTYTYIFRHRCLVCGRVYCRQCLSIGMGEMAEGRKCIECLRRRFSQRYIHKAGNTGCCMGYPSLVKQQELKWAEKGPRRSGENRYGNSVMVSRSRSPMGRAVQHSPSTPPSFVMSSPYSPKNHHPMPF